jgi:hypothetical protein
MAHVLNQCSSPVRQTTWLQVTHAPVEDNHRLCDVTCDIERRHVGHVQFVSASDAEVVVASLYQVVLERVNRRMYVARSPAIDDAIGDIMHDRFSSSVRSP